MKIDKVLIHSYAFTIRLLTEADGGGFVIEYPDLPGCVSGGDTPEEAMKHGDPVPKASEASGPYEPVLDRVMEKQASGVRLLQAAFHNRSLSLYSKLGFELREMVSVLKGPPLGLRVEGCSVRAATAADADACNGLCQRVHGHDRAGELAGATGQGTTMVVERDGRIAGYTTGLDYFGHSVAETNRELQALIGAANEFAGPGVLVPTRNAELFRWCLNHGLRVMEPITLMSMGLYNEPRGAWLPSILY